MELNRSRKMLKERRDKNRRLTLLFHNLAVSKQPLKHKMGYSSRAITLVEHLTKCYAMFQA